LLSPEAAPVPPATGSYAVRRFRPADQPALIALLGDVWGEDFARLMERIWSWKYDRNPHNPPGGHNSMVLTWAEEPVGFLGMMSANLKVADQVVPLAWGSELAVHPRHRGEGYRVIVNIGTDAEKLIAGTARTRDLAGLPLGFGAFDITRMISHKLILRPRRFLAAKAGGGWAAALGAPLVGWAVALAQKLGPGRRTPAVELEEVEDFGPEFDILWENVAPGYPLIPVRDRAFLQWRFRECPIRDHTVLAVRRLGVLHGYVVYRLEGEPGLRRAYIVDMLAGRDDAATWDLLLGGVEAHCRAAGADILTFTMSASWDLGTSLRRRGYLFRSPRAWITGHTGCKPEYAHLREGLEHSTGLVMTRADTDLDFNYWGLRDEGRE